MIYLIPIGRIDQTLFEKLKKDLQKRFGQECQILKPLKHPDYAFNLSRDQYQASKILERISELDLPIEGKVLGICNIDLYAAGLNFIFGQAKLKDRDCLISTTRLDPRFYGQELNEQIFYSRILKEAVHELGHTLGLTHCLNPSCVMHFSNTLADTDYKTSQFCKKCKPKYEMDIKI